MNSLLAHPVVETVRTLYLAPDGTTGYLRGTLEY